MADNRSAMVRTEDGGDGCDECGDSMFAKTYMDIRFRFTKEKIILCNECWAELSKQVEEILRPLPR
jgi:hypothetical protein